MVEIARSIFNGKSKSLEKLYGSIKKKKFLMPTKHNFHFRRTLRQNIAPKYWKGAIKPGRGLVDVNI